MCPKCVDSLKIPAMRDCLGQVVSFGGIMLQDISHSYVSVN